MAQDNVSLDLPLDVTTYTPEQRARVIEYMSKTWTFDQLRNGQVEIREVIMPSLMRGEGRYLRPQFTLEHNLEINQEYEQQMFEACLMKLDREQQASVKKRGKRAS